MKVTFICVGSARGSLADAIQDYEVRVGRYFDFGNIEAAAGKGTQERVREFEGKRILDRLPAGCRVYAVTRDGDRCTSRRLAVQLEELALYGPPCAAFVIGGAFGLDDRVREAADTALTLSDLTLPHDLARLVLLEQLYRAGTILRREPYHKGG